MPRYYFDVKDSVPIRDRVGAELADDKAAKEFGADVADSLRNPALGIGGNWYVSVIHEDGSEIARFHLSDDKPNYSKTLVSSGMTTIGIQPFERPWPVTLERRASAAHAATVNRRYPRLNGMCFANPTITFTDGTIRSLNMATC